MSPLDHRNPNVRHTGWQAETQLHFVKKSHGLKSGNTPHSLPLPTSVFPAVCDSNSFKRKVSRHFTMQFWTFFCTVFFTVWHLHFFLFHEFCYPWPASLSNKRIRNYESVTSQLQVMWSTNGFTEFDNWLYTHKKRGKTKRKQCTEWI